MVLAQLERLKKDATELEIYAKKLEKKGNLDRMRKKIINDMQEKNLELSTNNKNSVLKLMNNQKRIL